MVFKKGESVWLGRHHTEIAKQKIRLSRIGKPSWNKGKHFSAEAKQKMSIARRGIIPWNKGTKGLQVSWLKGKHLSEEAKHKISLANKGNTNWLGKHHTEESNMKNRLAHLGKPAWNKGIPGSVPYCKWWKDPELKEQVCRKISEVQLRHFNDPTNRGIRWQGGSKDWESWQAKRTLENHYSIPWEQMHLPKKPCIHHIDHDRRNFTFNNLCVMPMPEHTSAHVRGEI